MFENLSQREKILAALVGSLVPLALLVMITIWFFGQQKDRSTKIDALKTQIKAEQQRMTEALDANQRRLYYRSVSLPSNFQDASNDYQQWLKHLVRVDVGMAFDAIDRRHPTKIKFNGNVIGLTEFFHLRATTDLEQLVDFLTKFYQLDLLHRINSIKLAPKTTGSSGELSLTVRIEVLSLVDAAADEDGKFIEQFRKLELTADDYRNAIVNRNIFGPANNSPTLTVSNNGSYYSDKDLKIKISAKDADQNQNLLFSFVDSPIESATLDQKNPSDKRVHLKAPPQPAGDYTFKVRVTDDGFPPKSFEQEFKITVKEKVASKTPTKKPTKPDFKNSKETRITAIVKDRSGTWEVWINVRLKGEKHKLKVGQSFKLDGAKWEVTSIKPNRATFTVDGATKTFGRNQAFDGSEKTALLNR